MHSTGLITRVYEQRAAQWDLVTADLLVRWGKLERPGKHPFLAWQAATNSSGLLKKQMRGQARDSVGNT